MQMPTMSCVLHALFFQGFLSITRAGWLVLDSHAVNAEWRSAELNEAHQLSAALCGAAQPGDCADAVVKTATRLGLASAKPRAAVDMGELGLVLFVCE